MGNNHPVPATYYDVQVARAIAALPAAGAFDAAPLELVTAGFTHCVVYVQYDEAAATINGAVNFSIEYSPYSANQLVFANWFAQPAIALGTVTPGAIVVSNIQRESITFTPVGTGVEGIAIGPIELAGGAERMRIAAREIGDVANPGACGIVVVLYA